MEKAKQDAFDNARLQVIKDGYERAFECINKGLTADEAGDKSRALELYKKGRQHLLRAISVPSKGEECVGNSWESARQMQQKMQETLNNITTRMAILETSSDPESAVSAPDATNISAKGLYPGLPTTEKPARPPPPDIPSANGQPARAVGGLPPSGGVGQPLSPTRPSAGPAEQPPAYSPQAADGHISVSYGTDSGEMSLVGEEFYSHTSNSTPSPQSIGEDGEELLYIPHGVQIFFVTPEGQVSAPSYPGYLRLVRFTSDHSDRVPNRPPAFLQVRGKKLYDFKMTHSCSVKQSLEKISYQFSPSFSFLCPFARFYKMFAQFLSIPITMSHQQKDIGQLKINVPPPKDRVM